MRILLTALLTLSFPLLAEPIIINDQTPAIAPVKTIFQFENLDWKKVAERQGRGQTSEDSVTMMCDDSYYNLVEIQLPDGLEKSVQIDSDCKLKGVSQNDDFPLWLHFDGPDDGECTITVRKARAGETPLLMSYTLNDAC